jgi:DNA-binding MarR family transcriptional regulator
MYNIPQSMASNVCLAARARRLNRVLSSLYDACLRDIGLSIGQLDMLVTLLWVGEPIRSIDLAREMAMERSTVSRNIARLEAMGFVELVSAPDGRERLIRVTKRGETIVARAEAGWSEAQRRAREILGARAARHLEEISDRLPEAG